MSLSIPNALTIFRIIAIPLIVAVYFTDIQFKNWICVILFTLAGISDALDGYLARRWSQTSMLGAFLDPVADKLLVCVMLVLVVSNGVLHTQVLSSLMYTIAVIVIVSREIIVSALREWMAELGKRSNVAVSNIGKFKTGMQMTAIGCLLFAKPFIGLPILLIGELLLYVAAVLTVWSMTLYLMAAYDAVNDD